MAKYSINDLEKLCGIKAHTLRVWEKRYGIIEPKRTCNNVRYFLDDDLKKVLAIALLNSKGLRISKIAQMSEAEMSEEVAKYKVTSCSQEAKLEALIYAMLELDEYKLSKIIDHNIAEDGFETTINDIIYPFMDKLSMMWVTGSIKKVHEKFVTGVFRRKIISVIDGISVCSDQCGPTFLVYLPNDRTHDLNLLLIRYILLKSGMKVVNLGTKISMEEVLEGQAITQADYIFTMFNDNFERDEIQSYIDNLSEQLPQCTVLVSGYEMSSQNIIPPSNVRVLNEINEASKIINQIIILKDEQCT